MTSHTRRYCADPAAIALMKRDGIGWGHDLECGCFQSQRPTARWTWRAPFASKRST